MKKIFILTGEPSGDKLASMVVTKLQQNHSDIEYLSVGGSHLNSLGIKSIYDLKEITYIGFTSVILNLFKIRNKKVISIEGKGGTKKMLEKNKSKKFRNHGVLVKFPKKKQDLRVDLPTIGLKTIQQSKSAGLKGIVIKSKQHVFLDKNKCIKFANKNKMFISVK